MTRSLDNFLSGRYQACAINYNDHLKKLFGANGLDEQLTYSIQFVRLAQEQLGDAPSEPAIPDRLRAYIETFNAGLTHEEYNSERYSYRLLFKRKLVNRPGQADKVIEFIDPNSELAKRSTRNTGSRKRWRSPSSEQKTWWRRSGRGFKVPDLSRPSWPVEGRGWKEPWQGIWRRHSRSWFWYQSWIDRCVALCRAAGAKYRAAASA